MKLNKDSAYKSILNKNRVRILAFILGLVLTLPLMSALFNHNGEVGAANKGIVTADRLNVRTGEGTSSSILVVDGNLVKLTKGTEVNILSENNGWYKVSFTYSGKTLKGYVSADYVTKIKTQSTPSPNKETSKEGEVTADKLNVRVGAGTNYNILSSNGSYVRLSKGTKVKVLSTKDDWYYIQVNYNNKTVKGYVSKEYIKVTKVVNEKIKPTKIVAESRNISVAIGSKLVLKPAGFVPENACKDVTYWIKDKSIVSVAKDGTLTAKKTGTTTVAICSALNKKVQTGIKVTVCPKPTKITPATRKLNVVIGDTATLEVKSFTPKNAYPQVKYWVKDDSIVSVAKDGTVKAKKAGTTTVAIYSAANKKVQAAVKIVVEKGIVPTKVIAESRNVKVALGSKTVLKPAGFEPSNAYEEVIYWVKDKSVVTVDKNGNLTPLKEGTTTVAICSALNKKVQTGIKVTVCPVPTKVIAESRNVTVERGSETVLKPAGFEPANAYDGVVYWVKDDSIVSVDKDGNMIAKKEGTTTVAICSKAKKKIQTGIKVTVIAGSDDNSYVASLLDKGFPESYTKALLELHKAHPTWEFQAFDTGLTWEEALNGEAKVGLNLIPKSKNISWLSMEKGAYNWATDKFTVFDGSSWVTASRAVVAHYMDPRNFLNEDRIFMFELLSYQEDAQNIDGVNSILKGTAMYDTTITYPDPEGSGKNVTSLYSEVFMKAAKYSMVSPYHLASRCKQEIVTGVNKLSSITSGTVAGYEGYYNYYNIGASDSAAVNGALYGGLNYAKNGSKSNATLNKANLIPWTDRYRAIVGGANFIGATYIQSGQNTIYLEKFNVTDSRTFYHQYMSNVQGAWSESVRIHNAYKTMEGYETMKIVFSIPVYKDMPDEIAALPADEKNPNNWLKSLSVNNFSLTPSFNVSKDQEYSIIVEADTKEITINATTVNSLATVEGIGKVKIATGTNKLEIKVTAQNGDVRTYILKVVRPKA